jgi:hypothetical protein
MRANASRPANRLRTLLRQAIYPLLCVLSLALLPYQPEDPPTASAAQLAQGLADGSLQPVQAQHRHAGR